MRLTILATALTMLIAISGPGWADDWADCAGSDPDTGIRGCSRIIKAGKETRGGLATAYNNRGVAYNDKGESDHAIADFDKAIKLNPNYSVAFNGRGFAYAAKGENDRAIADYDKAIKLNPGYAEAYNNRGNAYNAKGANDRAIADYSKTIELKPDYAYAYYGRGLSNESKGDLVFALRDFRTAAQLIPQTDVWNARAVEQVAAIEQKLKTAGTASASSDSSPSSPHASFGARVALVIGNTTYQAVSGLPNAVNDADLAGQALRTAGFGDVTVVKNLDRASLVEALRTFREKADKADWALVYYAGHGIEVGGRNFLIPIDARLKTDRDIDFEAIALDQVLGSVEGASKIRIVALDACRDNPFAAQLKVSGAKRSIGRGLARVEPDGSTLVLFAAKEGTTASDGDGSNSPFATAFAKRVVEPGVELGKTLRLLSADVFEATGEQQEPVQYGRLPKDDFFFVPVK